MVNAVLTASRVLVAVSARSIAAVEDRLTLTQFRALVVLAKDEATSLHHLADRLGVGSSSALRTVDRLVDLGLVRRTPNAENRREVLLRLSEEGRHVTDAVTAARRGEVARILRRMPEQSRAELVGAFTAFAAAADEPAVSPPDAGVLAW